MIAPADFCQPSSTLDTVASVQSNTYDGDHLVPGADPYIAQLVEEHNAQLGAKMQPRPINIQQRRLVMRRRPEQVAVA